MGFKSCQQCVISKKEYGTLTLMGETETTIARKWKNEWMNGKKNYEKSRAQAWE